MDTSGAGTETHSFADLCGGQPFFVGHDKYVPFSIRKGPQTYLDPLQPTLSIDALHRVSLFPTLVLELEALKQFPVIAPSSEISETDESADDANPAGQLSPARETGPLLVDPCPGLLDQVMGMIRVHRERPRDEEQTGRQPVHQLPETTTVSPVKRLQLERPLITAQESRGVEVGPGSEWTHRSTAASPTGNTKYNQAVAPADHHA